MDPTREVSGRSRKKKKSKNVFSKVMGLFQQPKSHKAKARVSKTEYNECDEEVYHQIEDVQQNESPNMGPLVHEEIATPTLLLIPDKERRLLPQLPTEDDGTKTLTETKNSLQLLQIRNKETDKSETPAIPPSRVSLTRDFYPENQMGALADADRYDHIMFEENSRKQNDDTRMQRDTIENDEYYNSCWLKKDTQDLQGPQESSKKEGMTSTKEQVYTSNPEEYQSTKDISIFKISKDDMNIALKDIACSRYDRELIYFDKLEAKAKPRLKLCTTADLTFISKEDLRELIIAQAKCTVSINVEYTSPRRPDLYPGSDISYPHYNYRGKSCSRRGSGILKRVIWYRDSDNISCQCQKCSNGTYVTNSWGEIEILTATHLVFDDSEAKYATCILDCDSPDCLGEIIRGCTAEASIIGDGCLLRCYSHDSWLLEKLEKRCRIYQKLCIRLNANFNKLRNFIVTVVHQSEGKKQVYVGENPHIWNSHNYNSAQFYNAIHTSTNFTDASVYILEKELPESFKNSSEYDVIKTQLSSQCETFNGKAVLKSDLFTGPGNFEMHTDAEAVVDLQWAQCKKNPNHTHFTPIREMKLEHIPLKMEDLLFSLIKSFTSLTVKVILFDKMKNEINSGSGMIYQVETFAPSDNKVCTCHCCTYSTSALKEWALIEVKTTSQFVECVHGLLESLKKWDSLFIMMDDLKMEIVEVKSVNVLQCVTHDMSNAQKLKGFLRHHERMKQNLVDDLNLTVIVSHPHGCSKQVTFGKMKHQIAMSGHKQNVARWRDEYHWVKYIYETPTCPGSSGAYVYKLGDEFGARVHSGTYNFINYAGEYVALANM
ncbi:uncharacterized protein LOC131950344 [Physella acuta]|uniref:uncharacterized protein LOC131950344 n=1 Tax=Physella acuta TaxID=109671 RepID=UPI0027DE956B|nr:uncharacterized protein LOC131950344 [Physella acuta]